MANIDAPIGLWVSRHLTGGEIRAKDYCVTASATIFQGDLLKVVAAGTVQASVANDGVIVIGVAAEYKVGNSSGTTKILVYDDPYIIFGVQMDDDGAITSSAIDVFATANHLAGTGSTTTYLSGHELDESDIGTGGQLRILGLCNTRDPNNAWGDHADVEVQIAEHIFNAAVAGV